MVFKENPFFLSASLGLAVHTSTCGHVMHDSCWKNQMRSINQSEARRPYRLRQLSSFNVERKEYLCPLCECLTNTVMPVLPPLFNILPNNYRVSNLTFEGFLECINKALALGNTPLEKISGIIHIKDLQDKTDQIDDVDEEPDYGKAPEIELVTSSLPEDIGSAFKQLFPEFTEISFAREINEAVGLFNKASLVKIEGPPPKFIEPMMCFRTCAYTILALEILLRDSNKSLLGDLSSRQRDCIRNLIRLCGVSPSVYGLSGQYPLMFLRLLFEPQCSSTSILEWDTFGMLVSLTFSMPSLFSDQKQVAIPCGGTLDYFILNLLFLCNIVKIIITIDIDEVNMDTDNSETNNTPFVEYVMRIKSICKLSVNINRNNLEENIKQASLPFLRCCALFYHFLTDVPAPKTLTVGLGTYEELCAYLGLEKDFNKLINNAYSSHLSVIWCDVDIVRGRLENRKSLVIQPIAIPKLVTLPNDYSELINAVSLFTCPNSERDDTRNPTMCLVCGLMLCSQSYCCQTELDKLSVGACTHHTHTCGAGAGVFLRVRECEVLFLSSYCRGCFVSPPYLDEYGEADQGLRRGNPLTLCPIKLKKLEHIWLSHGIHEVISRAIETNTNLAIVATQWQHL
uniref:E3 ubiquitin-protein ligase n=1 Tax=Xenopsylla cheopis TaxID=163159 RepID=A0A6M2DXW0_XENCH